MQAFLRRSHQDNSAGNNSVMCGDSRANQRVEFWWSVLKKQCLQFWIDLFRQMQQDGYFSGDYLDKHLLRFCFLEIIQTELDNAAEVWNTHRIRSNWTTGLPCDKPVLLYTLSHLYGFDNLICQVDNLDIEVCEEECQAKNDLLCDQDLYELCLILMDENDWNQPEDPYKAVNLYQELRSCIKITL
ncbi:hypothetical protein ACJMK2_036627 [Sinanodonta woodiana]|uniref:Integrase core domain-containing protein n=1 Tax=Sinanodonta woodiana TaxID=1069815 RepID=A0ABD3WJN4_SINWO